MIFSTKFYQIKKEKQTFSWFEWIHTSDLDACSKEGRPDGNTGLSLATAAVHAEQEQHVTQSHKPSQRPDIGEGRRRRLSIGQQSASLMPLQCRHLVKYLTITC